MIKLLKRFLYSVFTNRLGHLLAVAHLMLVVWEFRRKPSTTLGCNSELSGAGWNIIAGRMVHWHYESDILKTIFILDIPSAFLTIFFTPIGYFIYPHLCAYTITWVDAFIGLICTSLQWMFIGFLVTWLYRQIRQNTLTSSGINK